MDPLIIGGIIIFVLLLVVLSGAKKKLPAKPKNGELPYRLKKSLLTERESKFFRVLLTVVENRGLLVVVKPRLADFLDVTLEKYVKGSQFNTYFNKIAKKHVDFLLLDRESFTPVLAIELDDKTHQRADRVARDNFVDQVYATVGLRVIHVLEYNHEAIDERIGNAIAS